MASIFDLIASIALSAVSKSFVPSKRMISTSVIPTNPKTVFIKGIN